MIYAQYNIIMYLTVTIANLLPFVFSAPKGNIAHFKEVTKLTDVPGLSLTTMFLASSLSTNDPKHRRMKRQVGSGAGKYVDAAQMPQIKVLRLVLQMVKNLFTSAPVGGAGPFDPDAVRPALQLFKYKVYEFFFPNPRPGQQAQ